MSEQFYFSMSTEFSSIWPIDRTLSGATTPGESGPGSGGSEEVSSIPQSSSITRTSPSDCLVSYPGEWGGVLHLCREAVSVFYNPSRLDKSQIGVIVYALDYNIIESEFKLQSGYHVHFQTDILGKDINLTPQTMS